MQAQGIRSAKRLGTQRSLDFEVDHPDHNFYAEGVVVSNSHSSAYAMITAYTLYLKANHPIHFYLALLRMAKNEGKPHDVIAVIEQEMRAQGFKLLPPDLTKSSRDFTLVDVFSIRYGLGMIRGISDKTVEKLELFQVQKSGVKVGSEEGQWKKPQPDPVPLNKFELFQNLKSVGLNIGIGSALIQAGCLSGYDLYCTKDGREYHSRTRLVYEILVWSVLTDKEKPICLTIGERVGWDVLAAVIYLRDTLNEKGKPLIRASRFETIKKHSAQFKEIFDLNRRNEALADYYYERHVLGYSYSQDLKGLFGGQVDDLSSTAEAKEAPEKSHLTLIGFVKDVQKGKTRKGNAQVKFLLSDEFGEVTVRMFDPKIAWVAEVNGRLPEEGDLVIVKAEKMKGGDTYFLDSKLGCPLTIVTATVYLKLSELRDKTDRAADRADKVGLSPSDGPAPQEGPNPTSAL